MRAPRHTLDQLVVFETVAAEGSFAAAARVLGRVPSAISYTINGLEDVVEIALFERRGRGVVLTADGQKLLQQARAILQEAGRFEGMAGELARGWEPELRLVLDGAIDRSVVLDTIHALQQADIPTHVRLHVAYQEGVWETFVQSEADLMFMLDVEERAASLPRQALPSLEMVRVVASSHPLATCGSASPEAIQQVPNLVVMDSSQRFATVPREAFDPSSRVLRVGDFASKLEALVRGHGHGWMPRHLVHTHLDDGVLVPLLTEGPHTWTYHPQLYERAEPPTGRACRWFTQELLRRLSHQKS